MCGFITLKSLCPVKTTAGGWAACVNASLNKGRSLSRVLEEGGGGCGGGGRGTVITKEAKKRGVGLYRVF